LQIAATTSVAGAVRQLNQAELAVVAKLAVTDRHVRAHEEAHLAAAGPYARSGPSYTMASGPDGKLYAVGGEVELDVGPVEGDPEATIKKAETVRAAANAPADPSTQDRQVAAEASRMEAVAEQEVAQGQGDQGNSPAHQNAYQQQPDKITGSILSLLV